MNDYWKEGVAFVRGINIYKNARITREQMFELCKQIENCDLKIVKIVNTDNIVFKQREGIHYAAVGSKLKKILSEHFRKPIYVTAGSMKTIRSLK